MSHFTGLGYSVLVYNDFHFKIDYEAHKRHEGAAEVVMQVLGLTPAVFSQHNTLEQRVVVIGYSMGHSAAIDFVLAYPQMSAGLVVLPSLEHGQGQSEEDSILAAYDGAFNNKDLERLAEIYSRFKRYKWPIPGRVFGKMWAWCRIVAERASEVPSGDKMSTERLESSAVRGVEEIILPMALGEARFEASNESAAETDDQEYTEDLNAWLEDFLWRFVIVDWDEKGRTQ